MIKSMQKLLDHDTQKIFNAAPPPARKVTMNVQIKSTQNYSIKPFSEDQLTRIREAVKNSHSLPEQLLLAVMLTGMRASECLPIKVKDLEINDDGRTTVKGVSVLSMDTPSVIEIIKSKSRSNDGYLFMSSGDSNTHMGMTELKTRFRQWLKSANMDEEGATPHLLRVSVLSAFATAQKK